MAWIESVFNALPTVWALVALVVIIGLGVVLLRGLLRLAMRAVFFGLIGVVVLGALYYLF